LAVKYRRTEEMRDFNRHSANEAKKIGKDGRCREKKGIAEKENGASLTLYRRSADCFI